ncbi:hypothetical protein [Lacrimispora sp.]|uniref:hypothetical protein n=1 Tax=Lacrimispora sp. TaxID=2719234 RepID=UPI00289F1F1F|nr:hypothetical protein [Lacrimispora sp.]
MKRIFVAAWSYPPKMSGESVVCKRTLENSKLYYDVCSCMQKVEDADTDKVRVFPVHGRYIKWPFNVVKQFLKLDKTEHYNIIMTRVMPPNGHFAGILIKLLRPHVKWVVYFSDPIWNSPFISFFSLFRKNLQQQPNYLLMKVFGGAAWLGTRFGDLLVFNNDRLARYVLGEKYNSFKDKIVIAPYGHEGVQLQKCLQKQPSDKVVIAHVGQIYGARSFSRVVEALEILKQNYPEQYNRLVILQVGFICSSEKSAIINSKVINSFCFVDEVDYEQSLEYMRTVDFALILDPYFSEKNKNIYVPVKIYDYMSVGAEIIAVADDDSATADIAKEFGCALAGHHAEEIANMLLNCVSGNIGRHIDSGGRFHCRKGVEILDSCLEQLLDND